MSVLFIACKGMKKLEGLTVADIHGSLREDVVNICAEPGWPQITEGLEIDAVYEFPEDQWFSVAANNFEYDNQMEKLADLVMYDCYRSGADEPGPFRELFCYTGRGVFGTIACAKLAADFVTWNHLARARPLADGDKDFYELYEHWWKMFEFAAKDGAVWSRST
jgi:hypothetical protein